LHLRRIAGLLAVAAVLAGVALRAGSPTHAFGFDPPSSVLTDQSYVPPTPVAVSGAKTCPNGTVEFLGSVCPIEWQTCSTGEVIYATQVCPGTTLVPGSTPVAATPGGSPSGGQAPTAAAPPIPLTLCGSESSFNPVTQVGALAPAVTVSIGQAVLCGAALAAGTGCQPAGESVDFGDGSQPFVSAQMQGASHAYSQAGAYSATDTISGCPASTPASVTVVPLTGLQQPASPAQQPVQTLVVASPTTSAASCSQPPATPLNVTVTAQPDLFHALIAWIDNAGDASGFQIGFGNGSVVGTAGPGVTQFSAGTWTDANTGTMDQVAPSGWWNFFSVTATNSCGSSNAAWGQVRMPCPDGSAGDPNGNATNSCSHASTSGAG